MKKSFAELFKTTSTEQQSLTEEIAKVTAEKLNRMKHNQESRENNIIIFNLSESTKNTDVKDESDQEAFKNLCKDILEINVPEIALIKRLPGSKKSNQEAEEVDMCRPLKVVFNSNFDKRIMMSKLYKLKNVQGRFSKISVQHDMSLDERAELKKLLQKAKDLNKENSNLNLLYKVRGPPRALKIVQIQTNKD